MLKSIAVVVALFMVGCVADDAEPVDGSDANPGDTDRADTCDGFAAESDPVAEPRECGIYGGDGELVLTGVYYWDSAAGITWVQDVKDRGGRLGIYGQIDQWTAGCYWMDCDMVVQGHADDRWPGDRGVDLSGAH